MHGLKEESFNELLYHMGKKENKTVNEELLICIYLES